MTRHRHFLTTEQRHASDDHYNVAVGPEPHDCRTRMACCVCTRMVSVHHQLGVTINRLRCCACAGTCAHEGRPS